MLEEYRLRVAYLLARGGVAIVGFLLVVSLVAGGVAGYTYINHDDTRTVTERTNTQTVQLSVDDSAVVTDDSTLWPEGTRLTDHPVYLLGAMPTLRLSVQTDVPDDTEVSIDQRVFLVVEASVDDELLWSGTRRVATRETTVSDGRLTNPATVNVSALVDRFAAIRERASVPVTLSARLRVETAYDTGRYAGTLSTSTPFSVGEDTYSVDEFEPAARTHDEQVTRRVETGERIPRETAGGAAVAVVAFLTAVVAGVVTRRTDDPERVRHRLQRATFSEWISRGNVPDDAGETTVTVASLPDLVDIAIDSNRRVVHDEARGVYAVLDGATVYEYPTADVLDFPFE